MKYLKSVSLLLLIAVALVLAFNCSQPLIDYSLSQLPDNITENVTDEVMQSAAEPLTEATLQEETSREDLVKPFSILENGIVPIIIYVLVFMLSTEFLLSFFTQFREKRDTRDKILFALPALFFAAVDIYAVYSAIRVAVYSSVSIILTILVAVLIILFAIALYYYLRAEYSH